MDPREFHCLSKQLATNSTPAGIRTAVSRAYYAVFHVGSENLEKLGFKIPQNPNGHAEVERRLHNCGDPEISAVGTQLGDLRSKRIKADYRLTYRKIENSDSALVLVKLAEKMIRTLDEKFKSPQSDRIKSSITAYLDKIKPQ